MAVRRTRHWVLIGAGLVSLGLLCGILTLKPLRIFVPLWVGLHCPAQNLCLDDMQTLEEARALSTEAVTHVESRLGPLRAEPKILFCSTRKCFETFADPRVAALYFWGAEVILINETGWSPHVLRHELIHHWQKENLGGARAALRLPRWYLEGMAYHLSDDPRSVIPHPTAQAQRARFLDWLETMPDWKTPPKSN